MLRRLKREVAPELPPRTESVLHVELDERERAVYDAVHAATREEVCRAARGGRQRARRARGAAAAAPGGLPPGARARPAARRRPRRSTRCSRRSEAVADGHKALVFSQWTSLLDLVEPHLKEAGIGFIRLDGTTRDRGAVASASRTRRARR